MQGTLVGVTYHYMLRSRTGPVSLMQAEDVGLVDQRQGQFVTWSQSTSITLVVSMANLSWTKRREPGSVYTQWNV